MEAPFEPMFGPMADDNRYDRHLAAVKIDAQIEQDVDDQLARVGIFPEGKFDGTFPVPAGDRVAGFKAPPPPGQGG